MGMLHSTKLNILNPFLFPPSLLTTSEAQPSLLIEFVRTLYATRVEQDRWQRMKCR
jgi:hypothetical protein